MPSDATLREHQRIKAALEYDPDTGEFRRRTQSTRKAAGSVVGSKDATGYIRVYVDGRQHHGHRLAWFYVHGRWPDGPVDHINGVRSDNRLANLRLGGYGANNQNRLRPQRNNTSGYLGVGWSKQNNKWRAQITLGNKSKHIGFFDTAEEAHQAYLEFKRKVHTGCTI